MKAKKSLGQNFLKSELALKKIIEAGEIQPDDVILEIGPGKGALTAKLLSALNTSHKKADKEKDGYVIAVEKDRELFDFLQEKFSEEIKNKKLILINNDILEFDPSSYSARQGLAESSAYKIIANIPYNITGAILKKFLTEKNQPECMVLMVQNEVAKRIMGTNPTSPSLRRAKESILSISVKAYGEPKIIMKVPARYFSPAPKVDSAIVSIKNISRKNFNTTPPNLPLSGEANGFPLTRGIKGVKKELENSPHPNPLLIKERGNLEERFWEIVKAGFAHKRKKLSSNLKTCGSKASADLGNKRAEDLTLSDWITLAKN